MDSHVTHGQLLHELRLSIARLQQDVEARSDPALAEIAHALDVIAELLTRSEHREGEGPDRHAMDD